MAFITAATQEPEVPQVPSAQGTPKQVEELRSLKSPPNRRMSITFDAMAPLPPPRITVQGPSETSEHHDPSVKGTPTGSHNERSPPPERQTSFQQIRDSISREIAIDIAKRNKRLFEQNQSEPRLLRPRKSAIALRKTRNACVRHTFLKMILGRDLAGPAKKALRKRAMGELVSFEEIPAPATVSGTLGL